MAPTGHTIDLRDAARMQGPVAFQVMVKPVGPRCNLHCSYCYYPDGSGRSGAPVHPMSDVLLEKLIRETIEANEIQEVTFTWHGGEPLLAGLDFFRRAVALQKRHAGGKRIVNTLQTNGTLLTADWAAFFRDNGFLVGLSLDGPEDIHDRFRADRGGHPTFSRVMRGLELLHRAGVAFNTLTTVNVRSEGRGAEVYRFLRGVGSRYLQLLPVAEPDGRAFNVSATGFGQFLCDVFDLWVRSDVGETFVSQFDAALCSWCGLPAGTCVYGRTCADVLTVECNGDVYACDHFADAAHRLGNLSQASLSELFAQSCRVQFVTDKMNTLPGECRRCPWLPACGGECPQHRFTVGPDGSPGHNALCRGYRLFFAHAAPYLDRMRSLLDEGRAPAEIMSMIPPASSGTGAESVPSWP